MAKQKGFFNYSGRFRDKIGYVRKGKCFLRSVPEKVTQSTASIQASKRFGRYSRKGRMIRYAIYAELDVRCDSSHINRLTKALINATGDHAAIKGFRFNENAGIDRFFTIRPTFSGEGILHIPKQELLSYRDIHALEVKVIATRIDFHTGKVTGTDTHVMRLDMHTPFDGTNIPLNVPGEGTLIVTLQMMGMLKDGVSANKQYMAADIIAVVTPPLPKCIKVHTHPMQAISTESPHLPPSHADAYETIVKRE